jgi:Hen1-like subunit of RNA repair complex
VALMLEVHPVGLIRRGVRFPRLDQYVNDRPYVASSFLSVAIARVYGTALGGRSKARPELVEQQLPLRARIAALPCAGGEGLLRRLFEPLGYAVRAVDHPLDERFPDVTAVGRVQRSALRRLRGSDERSAAGIRMRSLRSLSGCR